MDLKDRLRRWLGIENHNGPNGPDEHDEDILTSLRRELQEEDGKEKLTTGEIAEELSIGDTQTHNRLKEVTKEYRVTRRQAGRTDMWGLAPTEPTDDGSPVGGVVRYSSWLRQISKTVWEAGRNLAVIGFVFMVIGMTSVVSDISPPIVTWQTILAIGCLFGLAGGGVLGGAGVLKLLGVGGPCCRALFRRIIGRFSAGRPISLHRADPILPRPVARTTTGHRGFLNRRITPIDHRCIRCCHRCCL